MVQRVIPLVLLGAVRGREPDVAAVKVVSRTVLPPHTATMVDCCSLQERLLGASAGGQLPLTTGVLEIISLTELAVTAVCTTGEGAIGVQVIAPKTA